MKISDIYSTFEASFDIQKNDTSSRVLIKYFYLRNRAVCTINLTTQSNETHELCHNVTNVSSLAIKDTSDISSIVKVSSKIFNETGVARNNSTRVLFIVMSDFNFNLKGILEAQESSETRTFIASIIPRRTNEVYYFQNGVLAGINFLKEQNLLLALCGRCKSGWFQYRDNAGRVSCYKLNVAPVKEYWLHSSDKCQEEGGYLAAVESMDEMEFLQERLYSYILKDQHPINDSTDLSQYSEEVYIGLRRNSQIKDNGFQWMTTDPYHPVVLNHWLPGRPTGRFSDACGVWQFNGYFNERQTGQNQQNYSTVSIFSVNKSSNCDGWGDIRCGSKFTKFSLCETELPPSLHDQNLYDLPKANDKSLNKVLNKTEFRKYEKNAVSVSFYISYIKLHANLKENKEDVPVFDCGDGAGFPRYISYSFVCDCIAHCSNEYDEDICDGICGDLFQEFTDNEHNLINEEDCRICKDNICLNGPCLPLSFFSDDVAKCSECNLIYHDKYDNTSICHSACKRFQCLYDSQFRNQNSTCDNDGHLTQVESILDKIMFCPDYPEFSVFAPRCVFLQDIYGSVIGCRNFSHLQNCTDFQCQEGYYKCPGSYCISQHYVLDRKSDCPRGEDENYLLNITCVGHFSCWNSDMCLHPDLVCDGYPDCPQKDDELYCNVSCADGFRCLAGTVTVNGYNTSVPLESLRFIDPKIRFLNLSGIPLSLEALGTLSHLQDLRYIWLSKCNITNSHYYFWFSSNMQNKKINSIDMSYNEISLIEEYSFQLKSFDFLKNLNLSFNSDLAKFLKIGLRQLKTLDLSHTGLTYLEEGCFTGMPKLKHLNLSFTKLSSFNWKIFLPNQELDTLDLRGAPLVTFTENTFNEFKIHSSLNTDNFGLCCPQIRGSGIPAHVCQAPEEVISSCFDLVDVVFQRILLWLVSVISLVGNLTVIVYRLRWDRDVLKKAYGMFVTNLGISDLIMGLYMFIIAGADVYYRGMYVLHDKEWKESVVCKVAGFLATLSSETSTFFIFLITLDRFLVINFPYGQIQFSNRSKTIVVIVTWLAGLILASVIFLPIYGSGSVFTSNAMCLALHLSNKLLPWWEYSLSVFIVLNFVMFLLIALGQLAIFRAISANRMSKEAMNGNISRRAQDITIAKQLSLVVLSNFCCWFPVGFMGLLSLGGHVISNDVYAWTVVLVLPINSAVNPLLYTIPLVKAKWYNFKHKRTNTSWSTVIVMPGGSHR